jgi:hypothetical protein
MVLHTFSIWAEIKCDDFEAENEDDVRELIAESISDEYGLYSALQIHEVRLIK